MPSAPPQARNRDPGTKVVPPPEPAPEREAVLPSANQVWTHLAVGSPDDPLEREAADAAEAVVNPGTSGGAGAPPPPISPDPDRWTVRREIRPAPDESPSAVPDAEPVTPAAESLIVSDEAEVVVSGRMRRREFLTAARQRITAAVDEILIPAGRTTNECPYLEAVFRFSERLEPESIDAMIRRALPEVSGVTRAEDYLEPLVERARQGAREFVSTGELTGIPEGLPSPSSLGLGSLLSGIQLKGRAGTAGTGVHHDTHAVSVQAELGAGRPLDASIASRMGSALGSDFSAVRTHTDAKAGQWAGRFGARAFTLGQHVAFAPGEYRPGTLAGDALIAHELAHVAQQQAASTAIGARTPRMTDPPETALEQDADATAAGAMVSLWTRGHASLSRLGRRALPTLRSGLRLQGCRIVSHHDLGEAEMAALIERYGLQIAVSPDPGPDGILMVGQAIEVRVTDNLQGRSSPSVWVHHWRVTVNGETSNPQAGYTGPVTPLNYTVRTAGELVIRMEGSVLDSNADAWVFRLSRRFRTVTPEARSQEILGTIHSQSFEEYMASQEVARALLRPGDQGASSGDFRIRTTAENPSQAGDAASPPRMRYSVERIRGGGSVRYHWYASPLNWDGLGDQFHGFPRVTVDGQPAYDLGMGASAEWPAAQRNLYVIRCVVQDDNGSRLDEVSYLQSVLDAAGMQDLRRFEEHMERSQSMIGRLHPSQRLALAAVHVATATGAQTPLRLFLGRASPDSTEQIMLDLTPGLDPSDHTLEYRGATTRGVMGHFDSRNKYPEGAINLRVPPNNLNFEAGRWEFETEGASLAGIWSGRFGIGAMVLAVLGIAAAPFTEGGSLVVTVLVVGSAAAGITSGVLSLVDRFQNAEVNRLGVAIDVAGIAASFVGGAAAVRALRGGTAVLVANRTTRYLLWSAFTTEAVSGLLVSIDGMRQIDRIVSDSSLRPEERQRAIIRILTTLIVTGGLLAISGHQLAGSRTRLRGALGAEIEAALSDEVRLTLTGVLDDATLRSLNGASRAEVERFARILRDDPTAATRIVTMRNQLRAALATGADNAVDLEFALLRLRLESGGVPAAQGGRLVSALRAAGVPGASLGQVSGDVLASLRRIDAALEAGDMTAAIRGVDALPTGLMDPAAARHFEDALATAHRRTSPSFYRTPQARLPGGQAVAPTSRGGSLYYGTSGSGNAPDTVLQSGLPARGPNTSVEEHVQGAADTAFRGTTTMPLTPDGSQGAAVWADAGGWVYQVDGVPSWDANQLLQGRVRTPGGFGGNRMSGELEHLIPAHVPRERIRGYYPVLEGRGTSVRLGAFVPNPHYQPP